MARNEQPDPAEPKEEIKTSDFVIFPDLEGTPKTRTISLYGEVNEELCRLAILNLYYYRDTGKYEEEVDTEDEDAEPETIEVYEPIDLIVSTEGGSVTDMFSVYDCMRDIREKCEINTFGVGKVMSAGVLLLAGGTRGKRKVGRHCRLMLHAVSGGQFGSLKELEVDIKEVRWYQTQFIKALARETKLSEREIRSIFRKKTDTYFDAEQAVEWGIADEIV